MSNWFYGLEGLSFMHPGRSGSFKQLISFFERRGPVLVSTPI